MSLLPKQKSRPVTDIHDYTFLIYGAPKAGKTTFCANFERALFIATEAGHKFQEIYKVDAVTWTDIKKLGNELIKDKCSQFRTIIIDTADNAYKLCEDYICKKHEISHMSDLGFGKGYNLVRTEFMRFINALTQTGYGVVFISHADTRELDEKGVKRAFTDSTLSGTARKAISGLCDFILYAYIDSNGNRKLVTKGSENLNAGDRSGKLPKVMPLDFEKLKEELSK